MKKSLLVFSMGLALCAAVRADSWAYHDNVKVWRFSKGFKVEAVTDARRDGSARHYVKIVNGSNVLAIFNGVGFETLVESPDQKVYVGLSNYGLPGTAAIVFGRDGNLILYAQHWGTHFAYCSASVTIERLWFSRANPDVQFDADGGVTLNDCEGKRVNLFQVVGEALVSHE
jgi:hypothetical protein